MGLKQFFRRGKFIKRKTLLSRLKQLLMIQVLTYSKYLKLLLKMTIAYGRSDEYSP